MLRNLSYLWSLLPGIVTVYGNLYGGYWAFANLIFTLGFLSIIEWFMPENKSNSYSENVIVPDLILILHVAFQILCLSSLFYSVHLGQLNGIALIGATLSTGIHSGSSAIVVAHELIHRKSRTFRFMGKFLLFTVGNIYFYIEHLRVHHKWVGTDKDPATAKRNESLYAFFVRSMFGQITNAWRLEKERLTIENKSPLGNTVLKNSLLLITLLSGLYLGFGFMGVAVYLLHILIANFLLEYTNYIEHYGLSRKENERVKEDLSWQTDKVISRFFLIDLSRHSDHHYYASKPFHTLKSYEQSPKLPGGYASAIYLALIPPLWFKVVNRCLDNYKNTSVVNLSVT